ncbi:MAG TPA: metallophosphoesterase [Candidatus Pacearchaeota archaeon]|nr:metallophosphoesterase [Candidatus Pacearchaeota archaeon]
MVERKNKKTEKKKSNSKEKVKILAVGDIHGDKELVKRLAKKAEKENVDLVVLAGDISHNDNTENLIGPFVKAKKHVLLVPGNHDSPAVVDFLSRVYYKVQNLNGYYFIDGDLGIFGAGGADIGVNTIGEKDMFQLLKRSNDKLSGLKRKIMVTHMHPKGSLSEFSGIEGSKSIRKAIDEFKPDVLINAHIHEAGGIEEIIGKTKVINVSRKEKIVEI